MFRKTFIAISIIFGVLLFVGCDPVDPVPALVPFDLVVRNETDQTVLLNVRTFAHVVVVEELQPVGSIEEYPIAANQEKRFEVSDTRPTDAAFQDHNILLRKVNGIWFYDPETKEVLKKYEYPASKIEGGGNLYDSAIDDSTIFYGITEESAHEALFVPSDIRPFYLERDKDNTNLAYLIITDVPTP